MAQGGNFYVSRINTSLLSVLYNEKCMLLYYPFYINNFLLCICNSVQNPRCLCLEHIVIPINRPVIFTF